MAINDMVGTTTTLGNGNFLSIKPSDSSEWMIHNIYINQGDTVEIYRWSIGLSNPPLLKIYTTSMSILGQFFHCSINHYISIKNVSGRTIYISYDGVVVN